MVFNHLPEHRVEHAKIDNVHLDRQVRFRKCVRQLAERFMIQRPRAFERQIEV